MKVFITGAAGFVGSHVARQLVERGDTVRALIRPTSNTANLDRLGCDLIRGDLQDPESLERGMAGCKAVFHVAADYRLWSRNPKELYQSNVEGTRNVLCAVKSARIERMVYTSTVGALGIPPNGGSGTEETPVSLSDTVGHYKRSKFAAEELVRDFVKQEGLPVVIVNPSTPVGEGDVKPTPTGKLIVDFLNGRMPAYIQTGLNLVDVRDVATGHLLALERGRPGRRYILGHENVTLKRILELLAEITGRPAPKVRMPYGVAYAAGTIDSFIFGTMLRREPHIPLEGVRMARKYMYFDSSRAVNELGLPQTPIKEALARSVKWFNDNGYTIS